MTTGREAMERLGVWGVLLGPLSATPFKVYAVQAPSVGIPLWLFILITPVARLPRFLLVTLLASGAARVLAPRASARVLYAMWLAVWVIVYAALWSV
jgi:membrane protein YqaA with SNARE-associated domain